MKDAQRKQGRLYQEVQDGCLVLGYRRGAFVRETCISADRQVEIDEKGLGFRVHMEPHSEWSVRLDVRVRLGPAML